MRVSFSVAGVKGQERPRASSFNGHGRVRKSDADRYREQAIASVAAATMDRLGLKPAPMGIDVHLVIRLFDPLPKSAPKRVVGEPYVKKPDVDNVAKSVMDALTGICWEDDRQVTVLEVVKEYRRRDQECRTVVEVGW